LKYWTYFKLLQVVQLLLTKANPNQPIDDAVGLTPLHLAAISNQIEVAKVLTDSLTHFFTLWVLVY
jgi:ankyrin repeat protein